MWFIGVEVEQETSAPPLKKSWIRPWVMLPGGSPAVVGDIVVGGERVVVGGRVVVGDVVVGFGVTESIEKE